jgi:GNAT superfamily N-acetyltransferase
MEIGRAAPDDCTGILALQSANYAGNLSTREAEQGFLSAEFTPAQLTAIAGNLGIFVARENGRVIGYLCAHEVTLAPLPPVVEAMLRCARTALCGESALAGARLFVYGPVCIARSHRGRGLARRLLGALQARVAGRYEFGVTLVASANPHSLAVHVDGLGMQDAALFEHAGRSYHLLVFPANRGTS